MCKPLDKCRTGKDFVNYAIDHGANVRYANGSHVIINQQVVVPCHTKPLGTGLRCKIAKVFMFMFWGAFAGFALLVGLGIIVI